MYCAFDCVIIHTQYAYDWLNIGVYGANYWLKSHL